jgi:mannose-6-phosphate isomerase-like protein (cupin superfamily)
VIYVAAGVVHRFLNIEEDLRAIVFWAPPHTPNTPPRSGE